MGRGRGLVVAVRVLGEGRGVCCDLEHVFGLEGLLVNDGGLATINI